MPRTSRMGPDNYWFGVGPQILPDRRGAGVNGCSPRCAMPSRATLIPILTSLARAQPQYLPRAHRPASPRPGDPAPVECGRQGFPAGRPRRRPGTERVWISGIALRPDRHPLRRWRGCRAEPAAPQSWSRPGSGRHCSCRPPSGSGWRAYKWQPPLTLIAAPGSAARSPSRWRATRRHASRCIRARRREPRPDAAGR